MKFIITCLPIISNDKPIRHTSGENTLNLTKNYRQNLLGYIELRKKKHKKFAKSLDFMPMVLFIIITGCVILSVSPTAHASSIMWNNTSVDSNDGGINSSPVGIVVTDPAFMGNGMIDSVTVNITSDVLESPNNINLTLQETTPNSGIFKNTNLVMMRENYLFGQTSSFSVIVDGNALEGTLFFDAIFDVYGTFNVASTTDPVGFNFIANETNMTSSVFTTSVNFGSVTNPGTNTIAVSPGDIFTIHDTFSNIKQNGLILPIPPDSLGAILAHDINVPLRTITLNATYDSVSDTMLVNCDSCPGGISGGPHRTSHTCGRLCQCFGFDYKRKL